jgi:hypothetical protein
MNGFRINLVPEIYVKIRQANLILFYVGST